MRWISYPHRLSWVRRTTKWGKVGLLSSILAAPWVYSDSVRKMRIQIEWRKIHRNFDVFLSLDSPEWAHRVRERRSFYHADPKSSPCRWSTALQRRPSHSRRHSGWGWGHDREMRRRPVVTRQKMMLTLHYMLISVLLVSTTHLETHCSQLGCLDRSVEPFEGEL